MQTKSVSPFASVVGLGALKSDHTPTAASRRNQLLTNGAIIAVGVVLVIGALVWMSLASASAGGRSGDGSFSFVLLCFGCLAVPLGLFGLVSSLRTWQVGAALYENGFAYKDGAGVSQVSWADIESVWQNVTKHYRRGAYTGTSHVYTVQTKDKRRVVLNDKLPGVEQLGNDILSHSAVLLFPAYWQSLQGGQRLTFGPLAIDQQGLYSGAKTLPWSEIKAIKIQQGVISVKKEGGWLNWASVSVPQIPNFYVFYDLVRRFATVE
jgi:hypothetical protein